MLTNSEHAGVQQQVCAALSEFPYNNAGKRLKRSKIAEPGGIEAIVAAMKAHVLVPQLACAAPAE
jgi:hypothetical protein